MAKVKRPCDNSGRKHHAPYFLHPHEKSKIKKAKEKRAYFMGGDGYGGGSGGGISGRCQVGRKNWSNDNKYGDRNYYGNDAQKRVNYWMLYFRRQGFGWNTTHTSVFRAAWNRGHGTFVLPYYHEYWKLSGKTSSLATSTGSSEGGGGIITEKLYLGISEVISRHQGEASYAIFSSFLSDFSKVLDNLK